MPCELSTVLTSDAAAQRRNGIPDAHVCFVVRVLSPSITQADSARAFLLLYLFVFLCELAGHSVRDFVQVGADELFLCVVSRAPISNCEYCPLSERAFLLSQL